MRGEEGWVESEFVGMSAVFGVAKFVGATPEGKVRQYCGHFFDWRDGLAGPVAADWLLVAVGTAGL